MITAERLRRLTDAAREAAQSAADYREARDQAIQEAEEGGWSLNRIHRETGLSLGHVQRIVIRMTARRQAQQA